MEPRFYAPVQTGPGVHPASCTTRTRFYPEVKRPECGVYHPTPSSAEVKERIELYFYSPFWAFVACFRVKFTFTFTFKSYVPAYKMVRNSETLSLKKTRHAVTCRCNVRSVNDAVDWGRWTPKVWRNILLPPGILRGLPYQIANVTYRT